MVAIRDLTWQQLLASLPSDAIAYDVSEGVILRASAITGDNYGSLTDKGVCEFIYKLHVACVAAQEAANANQGVGERLDAFYRPTFGTPVDGEVPASLTVSVAVPIDPDRIVGNVS